jgi:hypothetical protein
MWQAEKAGAGEDSLRPISVQAGHFLTLECGGYRRFLSFFSCCSFFSCFSLERKKESGGDRRTPKALPHPALGRQYALVVQASV